MVDLSLLKPYGRVAVHCKSEEEAAIFMNAIWDQHPEKVNGIWTKGVTNWSNSPEGIYYVPRIFHDVESNEANFCQSSNEDWVKRNGYVVFPFSWFFQNIDPDGIAPSDETIESLFGIEV